MTLDKLIINKLTKEIYYFVRMGGHKHSFGSLCECDNEYESYMVLPIDYSNQLIVTKKNFESNLIELRLDAGYFEIIPCDEKIPALKLNSVESYTIEKLSFKKKEIITWE